MFKFKTIMICGVLILLGASFGISEFFARKHIDEVGFEIGAPFNLVNQYGQAVDERVLSAMPTALFFGFTHCPDICPTTLSDMTLWREEAGYSAQDLQIIFITIDPVRDTPELLKNYLAFFAEDIIGLTGDEAQVLQLVADWGIFREKVIINGDDFTFDHTATIFLLNRSGRLKGTISLQETADIAVAKIRNLVTSSS